MQLDKGLIKKPLISERGTDLANTDKYVFLIHAEANKVQVKQLIEGIYKVHVTKVNIIRNRNKGQEYKKAIVTIKAGETIDVLPHK